MKNKVMHRKEETGQPKVWNCFQIDKKNKLWTKVGKYYGKYTLKSSTLKSELMLRLWQAVTSKQYKPLPNV